MSIDQAELKDLRKSEDFKEKVGIYLEAVKGYSCKFRIYSVDDDFINLTIYSPSECRKSISLDQFKSFFKDELGHESSKDSDNPDRDGGLSESSVDSDLMLLDLVEGSDHSG